MTITYLFFGCIVAAVALVLFSAWLTSRSAYLAIVILLGVGLFLAEVRNRDQSADLLAIGIDVLIFGAFYYFVTVQYLMGRKASQITTRNEFKEAMIAKGKFSGFVRVVYQLPIVLLIFGVVVAALGAYRG